MGRPKKSAESKLDPELVDALAKMDADQLKTKLSEVNALEMELLKSKSEDQALEEAKLAYTDAGAVYKEGLSGTKNQRAYINQLLQDKGKV
jgi:hypothetical protein